MAEKYALSYAPSRFRGKVQVDASGCWLWTAAKGENGYAWYTDKGENVSAHRFAYRHYVGEISEGLTVDHLCRVRHCVNPAHMEIVERGENVLRGEGITAKNKRKQFCANGHEFTPENTGIRRGRRENQRWRYCRACMRDYRARKREGK